MFLGVRQPRRLWLVSTGDYSYGIYLYAFPIQQTVAAQLTQLRYFHFAAALMLTRGFAALSWHIDRLTQSLGLEPPFGVKVDTEGFELEVVKGLGSCWTKVSFIIWEASIRQRFVGSYQISELVTFMLQHDVLMFNVLNAPERHPRYYDILFLPRGSRLFC